LAGFFFLCEKNQFSGDFKPFFNFFGQSLLKDPFFNYIFSRR